jgi:hypothetical protein
VTDSAVTPLFVPLAMGANDRVVTTHRRRLPLASVPSLRPSDAAIYGMTVMDDRGRIVVRTVLKALGLSGARSQPWRMTSGFRPRPRTD